MLSNSSAAVAYSTPRKVSAAASPLSDGCCRGVNARRGPAGISFTAKTSLSMPSLALPVQGKAAPNCLALTLGVRKRFTPCGFRRAPKQGTLFCEVTDGIHAYGIASHRHAPEIEQVLLTSMCAPLVHFVTRSVLDSRVSAQPQAPQSPSTSHHTSCPW